MTYRVARIGRPLGLALVFISWAMGPRIVAAADPQPAAKQAAPAAPSAQPAPSQPPAGQVVYTFEDKDKMEAFARMWQQRQAVLLRMSVLNAYWSEEQTAITRLNEQISTQYHVDVSKSYTLDTEHRTLIERPAPPPQPTQAAQPTPPAPSPASSPGS